MLVISFESVLFLKSHSSPGSWSIISVMLEFASIYIHRVLHPHILAYNVCKSEMSCSYIKAAIRKQLKKKLGFFRPNIVISLIVRQVYYFSFTSGQPSQSPSMFIAWNPCLQTCSSTSDVPMMKTPGFR